MGNSPGRRVLCDTRGLVCVCAGGGGADNEEEIVAVYNLAVFRNDPNNLEETSGWKQICFSADHLARDPSYFSYNRPRVTPSQ